MASVIIYGGTIIAILVLVNTPTINFNYNEEIILNNQKFNVCGITVLFMGLISLVLSWSPRCSNMLKCCEVPNANPDEEDAFAVCFKIFDHDKDGILNKEEVFTMVQCMIEVHNQTLAEQDRQYPQIEKMAEDILDDKEGLSIEDYLVWTAQNKTLPGSFAKMIYQLCHIL